MLNPSPIARQRLAQIQKRLNSVIFGKPRATRLALTCLLAEGHLLIEDLPGVGKTTLAHTLANLLGLQFSRVQFTSDLLPADIVGISIYERENNKFRFLPGPVFAQLLLADEINRATPKTQSALLEAMEEHQVSVEGETRPLPTPFFVIATQNPMHQVGVFPLPESQLDRFLMRIELGYPDREAELALLAQGGKRQTALQVGPVMSPKDLPRLQQEVAQVHAAPPLLEYIRQLLEATRNGDRFQHGLSPRAGLGVLAAARAWAYLSDKKMVTPDDVQVVFPSVACHRLRSAQGGGYVRIDDITALIKTIDIP